MRRKSDGINNYLDKIKIFIEIINILPVYCVSDLFSIKKKVFFSKNFIIFNQKHTYKKINYWICEKNVLFAFECYL